MTTIPRLKTKHFQPGLELEHEIALSGVGVCVVTATLACNTARTAAQLIADSPVNDSINCGGPVIHSLGTPPTVVIPMHVHDADVAGGDVGGAIINFSYCTADNSAVYIWARSNTADSAEPIGVSTRLVCIR